MTNKTRENLLEQAEMLVRRQGYAGFSYADLAKVTGLRTASIHYHFPAKEDLGLALLDSYDKRYDEAMERIMTGEASALRRLKAYAELYLAGAKQGAGCLCAALATEISVLPAQFKNAVGAFFLKHLAWLERVIAAGIGAGDVRRTITALDGARLVLSALEGGLMMERVQGGDIGLQQTYEAIDRLLRTEQPRRRAGKSPRPGHCDSLPEGRSGRPPAA